MNYKETVDYILNIPYFAKKIGTENLAGLLCRLGNPERKSKVIHIAGTNGKGSTAKALSELLMKAGYNVGLFTSPHLVSINERIKFNNEMISDEDFVRAFERVKEKIEIHPSFFEVIFAMAAVYYEEKHPDYVIYETGMGGRLDATNVVEPVLCIITSIGMDHMEYLGSTLSEIAAEKAGIIKQGVPVVYLEKDKITSEIIKSRANLMKADAVPVEKSQYIINETDDKSIDFSFHNRYYSNNHLKIKKTALYQVENVCLALTAFGVLTKETFSGIDIDGIVKAALADFKWECRMEEIMKGVYVDGAHNEDAICRYAETLNCLHKDKRKILVFAAVKDKDYAAMIKELTSEVAFEKIIVTGVNSERKAPVDLIAKAFEKYTDTDVLAYEEIPEAMEKAMEYKNEISGSAVYCVGSLYLAGEIKKWKSGGIS